MATAALHLDVSIWSSIVSVSQSYLLVPLHIGAVVITVCLCVFIGEGPSLIFISKYILLHLRRSSPHSSMLVPYVLCSHLESVRSVSTRVNVIGPLIWLSPQVGRLSWTGKCWSDRVCTVVCLCEGRCGTPMFQWITIGSQYRNLTCELIWNPILAGVIDLSVASVILDQAPSRSVSNLNGITNSYGVPVNSIRPFPL